MWRIKKKNSLKLVSGLKVCEYILYTKISAVKFYVLLKTEPRYCQMPLHFQMVFHFLRVFEPLEEVPLLNGQWHWCRWFFKPLIWWWNLEVWYKCFLPWARWLNSTELNYCSSPRNHESGRDTMWFTVVRPTSMDWAPLGTGHSTGCWGTGWLAQAASTHTCTLTLRENQVSPTWPGRNLGSLVDGKCEAWRQKFQLRHCQEIGIWVVFKRE